MCFNFHYISKHLNNDDHNNPVKVSLVVFIVFASNWIYCDLPLHGSTSSKSTSHRKIVPSLDHCMLDVFFVVLSWGHWYFQFFLNVVDVKVSCAF